MRVAGLLLAAGAGSRMGVTKGVILGVDDLPWVAGAARRLAEGGCDPVVVAVGADRDRVAACLRGETVEIVPVPDWTDGIGASLRRGLLAMPDDVDAALVHLVDLPGVTAEAMRRVVEASATSTLARASFAGRPGHPVLIGRSHWGGVLDASAPSQGAGPYLAAHDVRLVECGDVAAGDDVDTPQALHASGRGRRPGAAAD